MATYRKTKTGWEAGIARTVAGSKVRRSATFSTKAEAQAWATQIESELNAGRIGAIRNKTAGDLFTKYAEEVSPGKNGSRWEILRLAAAGKDALALVPLDELDESHIAQWRDRRLAHVADGTVRREWTLLSNVFTKAHKEWKWIPSNPMLDVKRPPEPPSREATWNDKQIEKMLVALGYNEEGKAVTIGQRVACAFLFAMETACRAGELRVLTKQDINGRVATVLGQQIGSGKTEAAKRKVPLSSKAIALLTQVDYNFDLTARQLDSNFRKAKKLAGIDGVTFHDTRATAITRLAKKLDILDLARAIGHKNLEELMTYYREDPQAIAKRLG